MPVQHVNRKGDTYYLQQGKSKAGKPAYFFKKKPDGPLVHSIPEGFEIHENPNAQVFLRRIQPKVFTEKELAIIHDGVRKLAGLKYFCVDLQKNAAVIYLSGQSESETADFARMLGGHLPPARQAILKETLMQHAPYMAMMRFVVVKGEPRLYHVERWCFRGSIDRWIFLDESADLKALVKQYCPHLGKESFYELM